MQPITPHLVVQGGHKALTFYAAALGAKTLTQLDGPGGLLMHATLEINGARVMLSDEFPGCGNPSPLALKGTPIVTHLVVADCDAALHRAASAGAKVIMPAEDMFWGDRYGQVEDPFGHRWSFGQPKKAVSPEEMAEALKGMSGPGCG
ncbi:MAG: VOC family protein [Proteobacteria bacterium]|nr:VOC family protein [Pseudomonadota bacterium]